MKLEKQKFFRVVGEFALIVFGILLALQVDNWNDDRKQSQFANETFLEIKSSLAADLRHVRSRIMRLESISTDLKNLSELAKSRENASENVSELFPSLASYILLELNTSSYETLKLTGLNVIKNSELRFKLVNLYDYSYPKINWMLDKEFNGPNEKDYWPMFNQYASYTEKSDKGDFYVPSVTDTNQLLSDPDVINAVRQKFNKARSMTERLERLEKSIIELSNLLESELN